MVCMKLNIFLLDSTNSVVNLSVMVTFLRSLDLFFPLLILSSIKIYCAVSHINHFNVRKRSVRLPKLVMVCDWLF